MSCAVLYGNKVFIFSIFFNTSSMMFSSFKDFFFIPRYFILSF